MCDIDNDEFDQSPIVAKKMKLTTHSIESMLHEIDIDQLDINAEFKSPMQHVKACKYKDQARQVDVELMMDSILKDYGTNSKPVTPINP